MYNIILLPVDGSEISNHAAEDCLRLASRLGAKVILLYVVDIALVCLPEAESGMTNVEIIRESFKEQGDKLLRRLSELASGSGVSTESIIAEGDVHDEIIRVAKERNAELIVMGTHGRRGLNRLLLGSVAESVARRAHCAVLLIRPE
ncbi:MAG: universal stress protein [Nitrospirota bacterium]